LKTNYLYIALLVIAAQVATAQCLQLRGFVTDFTTKQPIAEAKVFIKEGAKRTAIGQSEATGRYAAVVPCGAAVLLVEKKGYRTLVVPINYNQSVADGTEFVVSWPLIPLDKQVNDRPYSQAEQKDFVLKDTSKTNTQATTRKFRISDAINDSPIAGKICLFYTKNGKKDCFNTTLGQQTFDVNFTNKDIVALEASTEGYQSYNGNLIVDQLDGQSRLYEIKLSRELTVLSVTLTEPKTPYRIIVKTASQTDWTDLRAIGNGNRFYGMVSAGEAYELCILNEKKQVTNLETVSIKTGFNYFTLTPKIPPKPETPPKPTALAKPEPPKAKEAVPTPSKPIPTAPITLSSNEYVVYFEQSNYELKPEATAELDKIAAWLRQNPTQKVRVIGHTDNVGNGLLNVALSEFRAKVTKSYLAAHGVPENQIDWRGVGGKYPIVPNDNEENKKKNRRVEVKVINE
jgi:outer membrane protein OmpA-like peptidoglycan-associated protein